MKGFLFDPGRCTGCNACELACSTENGLGWGRSWRQVFTFNGSRRPGLPAFHLSMACNHCEEAPCLEQCPALAISRDGAAGTVQIDPGKCMGCRYCAWVCPFDAPRFDQAAGVMGKCTLCSHRLSEDREPACVEGCPTSALGYGELHGERELPGFPASPARPAVRFTALREGMRPPESTWSVPPDVMAAFTGARPESATGITLAGEWPLLIFTLLVSALAGWMMAAAGGGPAAALPAFAGLAALGAGVSTLHLGRPARAWRAALNWRRSWLSREILAFGGFAALSFLALWDPPWRWLAPVLGGPETAEAIRAVSLAAAAVGGLATVFCADRVYDPVRAGSRLHSADLLLTGPLVAALLLRWPAAAVGLAGVKAALHLMRLGESSDGEGGAASAARLLLSAFRVGVGLLLPPVILLVLPGLGPAWLLVPLAAGEILDRAQFYTDLRAASPRETFSRALAASSGSIPGP